MKPRYLSLDPEVPADDYWDMTLLKDLLKDYSGGRQVVVIPGARQAHLVDDISLELKQYPKVLIIVTSDEQNNFPVDDLYHPNMKLFVSYPNKEKHQNVDGFLPIGYAPNTRKLIEQNGIKAKSLDWFFAGQINHDSRQQCLDKLVGVPNGRSIGSNGFGKGLDSEEYMKFMCMAKVVPCPRGNISPDSFRLYEALEAGCIPIVEDKDFWTLLFGKVPFPIVEDWTDLADLIHHFKDRQDITNRCSAWWQLKKRELKWMLQS